MAMLHETLSSAKDLHGQDYFVDLMPDHIQKNLNPKFDLRPYQKEAFGRFEFYLDGYPGRPKNQPCNVMYHMATGSGKTLMMAGEILSLYKRGYRHFLFFVNSTNIIKKTKENFLNKASSKYLFNDNLNIDGQIVNIREVENFSSANPDDISIVFTTIQGLHTVMTFPKENALSMEDFENQKVVLISDEAHHLNVETKKKKNTQELVLFDSWESTVKRIFHAHCDNIMLEFTATAELSNPDIKAKYNDVVLFDYPLKNFRIDGYSKEVKVLQSDSEPFDRALQAIILSQFRRKIFEKNKLLIKPVILFKSKTIAGSKAFHKVFTNSIATINEDALQNLKDTPNLSDALSHAFEYFDINNISLDTLSLEIREDFSLEKTIEVNSKEHLDSQQILLNTLEDADNEIRAVFAVDKLNEGWDVLNLFDIVRLYDVRSPKETIKEAQLIGRGARYCPFKVKDDQPLYQRKYDVLDENSEEHELKVCEELYYHSAHNPKYIQELNKALQEIGIKPKVHRELPLRLKDSFKKTKLYDHGFVYTNKRVAYDRSEVKGLDSSIIDTSYSYSVRTGSSSELTVFESTKSKSIDVKTKSFTLLSLGKHVVRKALASNPQYQFRNLSTLFPNLKSIDEFIESEHYLANIKVKISGHEATLDVIPQKEKLKAAKKTLNEVAQKLEQDRVDFKGTKEFRESMVRDIFRDKVLNIVNDGNSDQEFGIPQSDTLDKDLVLDLASRDWFAFNENYGTSEEKHLVRYIDEMVNGLKEQYDQVYLLRNEKHFKIFSFDDGRAFEPDFVLFLTKKGQNNELTYQVFVEPKGGHLLEKDAWKQKFLLDLKDQHKIENVWTGKEFIAWGMPFYNKKLQEKEFEPKFAELLHDSSLTH